MLHRCISAAESVSTASSKFPRAGSTWINYFAPVGNLRYRGVWAQGLTGAADFYFPGDVVYHKQQFISGSRYGPIYAGMFVCVSEHDATFSNAPDEDYGTWAYWYPLQQDPWNGAGRTSMFIPVSNMYLPISDPCGAIAVEEFGVSSVKTALPVAWFAAGSNTRIAMIFSLPDDWDFFIESAYDVTIHWMPDSTNTGNVIWYPYARGYDHSDLMTSGPSQESTLTMAANGTQYDMHMTSGFSGNGGYDYFSGADDSNALLHMSLMRQGASDTFTGNAGLLGITIHYNKRWNADFTRLIG